MHLSILAALTVGLVSLGFYLSTMPPGLTWAHDSSDGGELAAAAKVLGIPHPPGYPSYVLLAHLFTLLPVGEIATRTNLFSAVCAAGTAALLTWTLARSTRRWIAGVGAGLAVALSPLLWFQAVVTEVHALNALFTALLLMLALRAEHPRRSTLRALAIGLLWGLSLGNHLTALFLAPIALLALGRMRWQGLWGGAGLALGLLVYAYLPLRAAANPPINWGDPQTPERFWWMISGGPYEQFLFSLPRQYLIERLLAWTNLLTRQFGWIGLVVTALGAASFSAIDRPLFAATAVIVATHSTFAIGYNTTDSYLYLISPLVCLGLWLGEGIHWLVGRLTARTHWAGWAAAGLAILLPLAGGVSRIPSVDLSDDRAAETFEAAILTPAPAQAVIISQGDASTFALWYFQHAMGRRPDVTVVDSELLGYDWYVAQLSQQHAAFAQELPDERSSAEALRTDKVLDRWRVAQHLGRPICHILSDSLTLSCVEP